MKGNVSQQSPSSVETSAQRHDMAIKVLSQLLPISIAITLINGLVFILFYRRLSLRTASNYLLLGLAICDFFTGTINIPYLIIFAFGVVPSTMAPDFGYWLYMLHTLMAVSAAYHILAITAERYLAIIKPFKHHIITTTTVLKVSLGIWMLSAFIAFVPLAYQRRPHPKRYLWLSIHTAICLLVVFFVPYVFIVFAYTTMFRAISARRKCRLLANHIRRPTLKEKRNTDRKCIMVFATMAAIFALCWLPYFTLALAQNLNVYLQRPTVNPSVLEAFVIIRYLTSITNPLLYTFFKRDFLVALKNLTLKRGLSFPAVGRRRSSLSSFIYSRQRRKSANTLSVRFSFSSAVEAQGNKATCALLASLTVFESSV